ncbi:hypothetical protein SEA_SKYSAND_63 [Gordonia phage Skysand]|uniref:Uncharacterized protein n=1 Tax=Gordonia phage Skysand TaxID=2301559 RepID=A0A385DRP1_9CAUD|nr:hypothetical protein KNU08_gp63 [Gordonia phage Skysand]AXQ62096.1 hypothetical protein SEA_SKYSAND_63 [Gordonia phage Skysand]
MEDTMSYADELREIAKDQDLLEVARKAIEDELIEWRDSGISTPFRNNGLVVKYVDGQPSDIIRFGPETAVQIGLQAIANHLEGK